MLEYAPSLAGGIVIGIAASIVLIGLGRIAGISGITWNALYGSFRGTISSNVWRIAFLIGLILGPLLVHGLFSVPVPSVPEGSAAMAVLGGLLVGFGTRLGSGCTSGHGICGIARFSTRSVLATLTFMACGFACVFVIRHLFN